MAHKVGRPLKFEQPSDLQDAIEEYLNETPMEEWTVTGLCLAIGTNKQVLLDYEKREGFSEIVKEAKLYIENAYEISLRKYGRSGDIFALKNFGWRDKTEQEHTGSFSIRNILDEIQKEND
jgi:hypothetical protein